MTDLAAYHEAGHAFMALYVGARVRSVTIDPDRDDGPDRHGDTQVEWPLEQFTNQEYQEKTALVALAGPVAEMIHSTDTFHPGLVPEWASDWRVAWNAAAFILDEPKRLVWLEQATRELYRLLTEDDHWAAVAAIVDHLLAYETLESEELEEIVEHWMR